MLLEGRGQAWQWEDQRHAPFQSPRPLSMLLTGEQGSGDRDQDTSAGLSPFLGGWGAWEHTHSIQLTL